MKLSRTALIVLRTFLQRSGEKLYGYDIMQVAGVSSGTLYPLLLKLENEGFLTSMWERVEPRDEGRPRRRLYRLTASGQALAMRDLTSLSFGAAA